MSAFSFDFLMECPTVNSNSFVVVFGTNLNCICAGCATSMTVYWTGSYGVGTILYSDSSLTTPVDIIYTVVSGPDALIRYIDSASVGFDTGFSC